MLADNKDLLINFHREEHRVDLLAREDVVLRIKRPLNPHKEQYSDIVSTLGDILEGENIIGYHCTRLTPSEIKNIHKDGMKILTSDLVTTRLSLALEESYLTQEQYDFISNCSDPFLPFAFSARYVEAYHARRCSDFLS